MKEVIYRSFSPKYTDEDIERLAGVVTFVSFERLLNTGIYPAIGRRTPTETLVGMKIDHDGITCYLENE